MAKAKKRLQRTAIIQPLLQGREFRVTVCRSGAFAVAELVRRRGRQTLWRDASRSARVILPELHDIVVSMNVPALGFDVIQSARKWFLLDVNHAPSLRIHLATDQPRDLSEHFLDSWLEIVS